MDRIADIALAVVTVSAIFVLVRPNSQGPQFVSNVGSAFSDVLKAATGGGSWN